LLSFELFIEFAILILDLRNCLLLHSVLFLELLLHLVSVINVLIFRFFFGAGDTVLGDCDLLSHLNVAARQSLEFFLHATFIKLVVAERTDMVSNYLLIH
jgi:hypothetical protein